MDILEHTRALREERMNLINETLSLQDKAIGEKRVLSSEESAEIARRDSRIAEIDQAVKEADDRHRRETESAVAREADERAHGAYEAQRRVRSENDELRAWAKRKEHRLVTDEDGGVSVNIRAAQAEREMIRRGASPAEVAEQRALLWDTGSSGSLVPTTLARRLYEYMEASIAAFRMPTTKITTDSGETMQFPRLNAHGIATQVIAQGTAIGGTDPTFARMTLDAYKYGQLVQVANEVLQDSGIDMAEFLGRDIGRAIGRVIDADLIAGTGSGEPQGMTTAVLTGAAGTVATGGSLLTPSYENLVDLVFSVNDEYRNSQGVAFLFRDATAGNLMKLRDGAGGTVGAPLWQPSFMNGIQGGVPDRLLNYPFYTDPNVASLASNAKVAFFGDFSAYYIRQVGNVVIERSDDYAFNVDEATFRGKWRVDGDYIDLTAVNLLKMSV